MHDKKYVILRFKYSIKYVVVLRFRLKIVENSTKILLSQIRCE